jgi:hypothetical protein
VLYSIESSRQQDNVAIPCSALKPARIRLSLPHSSCTEVQASKKLARSLAIKKTRTVCLWNFGWCKVRPNPSIERDVQRLAPLAAPHVKR